MTITIRPSRLIALFLALLMVTFALAAGAAPSQAEGQRDVAASVAEQKAAVGTQHGRVSAAAVDTQASSACFADPTGDTVNAFTFEPANYPKADLLTWCAEFSGTNIRLRHENATASDPSSDPNWINGLSSLLWGVDLNGDGISEVDVYLYNTGNGVIVEVRRAQDDSLLCSGTPAFDGMTYSATFPATCIGSPSRFWADAFVAYDSQWNDPDAPVYADIADHFGGPVDKPTTAPPPSDSSPQPAPDGGSSYFSDVNGSHAANIDFVYERGLIKGCGTDPLRYCPGDPLTRAQFATIMANYIRSQGG